MIRTTSHLVLASLLLASCSEPPSSPPAPAPIIPAVDQLGRFRQLVGAWMDSTSSDRYTMFESWLVHDDSTLVGHGYALAGKDTVFVEQLRLEVRAELPTYLARIGGQNEGAWVPFQAEPHGTDSLIFENPGHDYPQCISYIRADADRWAVTVSGTENGVPREDRSLLVRR